jgi:hypothetical protein
MKSEDKYQLAKLHSDLKQTRVYIDGAEFFVWSALLNEATSQYKAQTIAQIDQAIAWLTDAKRLLEEK